MTSSSFLCVCTVKRTFAQRGLTMASSDPACANDANKMTVSLACPLSRRRMTLPARGIECTHMQVLTACCVRVVNVSLGCAVNAPLRSQPATTETAATAVCLFTENNKKSIKHVCDGSVSCLSCSTDSSQNVQQLLKISLENSYLLGTPRTHARTHTHTHLVTLLNL